MIDESVVFEDKEDNDVDEVIRVVGNDNRARDENDTLSSHHN